MPLGVGGLLPLIWKVCGMEKTKCLVCSGLKRERMSQQKGKLRSIEAGGLRDGAELLVTSQRFVSDAKVLAV